MEGYITEVREIRGIPNFLLKEYLVEMGGTIINDGLVQSQNFAVEIERMEPFRLGSLVIGQNRLIIHVLPECKDEFFQYFGQKTLRAGG